MKLTSIKPDDGKRIGDCFPVQYNYKNVLEGNLLSAIYKSYRRGAGVNTDTGTDSDPNGHPMIVRVYGAYKVSTRPLRQYNPLSTTPSAERPAEMSPSESATPSRTEPTPC